MADNAEEVVKLIRSVFNKCVSTLIAFLHKVNCIYVMSLELHT